MREKERGREKAKIFTVHTTAPPAPIISDRLAPGPSTRPPLDQY